MPISIGTTTVTALYLGTTSITSAYLGNTQVFGGSFTPLSLFSGGSQGIWLDPSDLSTMFSDRAGTTPVTTPGTVVGLRLDKSKGLALGAELVTNGDFATDTWWSKGAGCSISGGFGVATAANSASGIYRLGLLTSGTYYEITITVASVSSGGFRVGFLNVTYSAAMTAPGTYTFRLRADSADFLISTLSATTGTVDNVSVKQVTGNHATAPTDAARPTYGVEPKGGRRNLLTWTEDFGNAAWTPLGVTVAPNAGTAPDGTVTADKLVASGGTLSARYVAQTVVGAAHTASAYFKAAGVSTCGIYFTVHNSSATFDLTTGEVFSTSGDITSPTITPVGDDGWYRCSASTSTTTHNAVRLYAPRLGQSFTSDGTSGILIWGAQLERDA